MNLRKWLKGSILAMVGIVHLDLAIAVNYVMPSYQQTVLTGMEVRRMDKDGVISAANPADGEVRDVYFLFTEEPETKKIMVYRNEDTGWGFPFYFKFGSADIQAKSQAYINEKQLVEIGYYGWRINWLNEFKNIISVKPLKEGDKHSYPWVSYFIYLLLAGSYGFVSCRVLRKGKTNENQT